MAPEALEVLLAGTVPTKPTTALALLLLGVVLGWPDFPGRVRRLMATASGALAVEGMLAAVLQRPLLASSAVRPAAEVSGSRLTRSP